MKPFSPRPALCLLYASSEHAVRLSRIHLPPRWPNRIKSSIPFFSWHFESILIVCLIPTALLLWLSSSSCITQTILLHQSSISTSTLHLQTSRICTAKSGNNPITVAKTATVRPISTSTFPRFQHDASDMAVVSPCHTVSGLGFGNREERC